MSARSVTRCLSCIWARWGNSAMARRSPEHAAALRSPSVQRNIEQLLAGIGGSLPRHPDARAKFTRLLESLAIASFEAGADFTRRQWEQTAQAIPKDAHDSYAAGVIQALQIADDSACIEEVRDRVLAHAVFVAPNQVSSTSQKRSNHG